ncbi:MAG: hypothetical protein GC179_09070 [Anaerolineaceae bacterium]|nr:hypothetical protein [Anaerolineaceae bacterium]
MTAPIHELTITLTDEEFKLLQTFAAEHGFAELEAALPAVLHDRLWDEQFAASQDLLSELAAEAHQEYLAGNTEELDPDTL